MLSLLASLDKNNVNEILNQMTQVKNVLVTLMS